MKVYSAKREGHSTRTQMGSGHFDNGGNTEAILFIYLFFFSRNIGLVDNNDKFIEVEAQSLVTYATRPSCYNVVVVDDTTGGTHFYFGGPRDILHNV